VDLRAGLPALYDQGQLGSCTGNAIAAAVAFDRTKEGDAPWAPSRLFIYYCERMLENTVSQDAGAMIRDGMKGLSQAGVCPETVWPYVEAQFATRPTDSAFQDAVKCVATQYSRVDQTLDGLKGCLAAGFPVVFGFTVYESFEGADVARTGKVSMPAPGESAIGGHAVLLCGYTDDDSTFIVRNSWGPGWGDGGYFWMPYAYLIDNNLADDFWTLRTTSS
jgi:C1A family cysteine protease